LRWRYKTGFASGASEKKFFVPPLFQNNVGYKQANISRGLGPIEYIENCCLVVTLINIEAKIIFIGPPPPIPLYPAGPKSGGTLSPTPPVVPPMHPACKKMGVGLSVVTI